MKGKQIIAMLLSAILFTSPAAGFVYAADTEMTSTAVTDQAAEDSTESVEGLIPADGGFFINSAGEIVSSDGYFLNSDGAVVSADGTVLSSEGLIPADDVDRITEEPSASLEDFAGDSENGSVESAVEDEEATASEEIVENGENATEDFSVESDDENITAEPPAAAEETAADMNTTEDGFVESDDENITAEPPAAAEETAADMNDAEDVFAGSDDETVTAEPSAAAEETAADLNMTEDFSADLTSGQSDENVIDESSSAEAAELIEDGFDEKVIDESSSAEAAELIEEGFDENLEEDAVGSAGNTGGNTGTEEEIADEVAGQPDTETVSSDAMGAISYTVDSGVLTIKGDGNNSITSDYLQNESGINSSEIITVVIGSGIASIGESAFSDFAALESVTIPNTVTSIGNNAFSNCSSLTEILYSGTVNSWENLSGSTDLNNIVRFDIAYVDDNISELTPADPETNFDPDDWPVCWPIPQKLKLTTKKLNSPSSYTLKKDTDYILEYSVSKKSTYQGIAEGTITGKRSYYGTKNISFLFRLNNILNLAKINYANSDWTAGEQLEVTYTGSEIKPNLSLKFHNYEVDNDPFEGTALVYGKDYTVTYSNNIDVTPTSDTASCTYEGIGEWYGKSTIFFTILPKNINDAAIDTVSAQTYTGSELKPEPVITYDEETLVAGTDYELSYSNNINVTTSTSRAKITISGIGGYTGETEIYFSIKKASIKVVSVAEITGETYNGESHEPEPVVTFNNKILVKGKDYSVSYQTNKSAGKGYFTLQGLGNFTDSNQISFKIDPFTLSQDDITVTNIVNKTYSGEAQTQDDMVIKVDLDKAVNKEKIVTLDIGWDYTAEYADNINASKTAAVKIKGKKNYTGTVIKYFTIKPVPITDAVISFGEQTYCGAELTPDPKVVYNGAVNPKQIALKDSTFVDNYTLLYENNINAGAATATITGKNNADLTGTGNFTGETSVIFTIDMADIADTVISDSDFPDVVYDGTSHTPRPTVKLNGNTLKEGSATGTDAESYDYSIAYRTNRDAGTAQVLITANVDSGNWYRGTVTKTFNITPKPVKISALNQTVSVGGAFETGTDQVQVTEGGLVSGHSVSSVTLTFNPENTQHAGTGTITPSNVGIKESIDQEEYDRTGNYTFTYADGTLTINKGTPIAAMIDATLPEDLVYDGQPKVVSAGKAEGYDNIGNLTVTYYNSDGEKVENAVDAGKYTFTVSAAESSDYTASGELSNKDWTFTVEPRPVNIIGIKAEDKEYDGTLQAAYSGTAALDEVVTGDTVSASDSEVSAEFEDADAGENKKVIFAGWSITGEDAVNYTLAGQPESTAAINPKAVSVENVKGIDKAYDGTTDAELDFGSASLSGVLDLDSDSVGIDKSVTGAFEDANEGENKKVLFTPALTGDKAGNYCTEETIVYANITAPVLKASDLEDQTYTGRAITPKTVVSFADDIVLTEGTDYTLIWENNTDAGTARLTITGIGTFKNADPVVKTFQIAKASISDASVSGISGKTYNGKAQTQSPTVKVDGNTLTSGTDYSLSYKNNTDAGTATVTITGKGKNYKDSISRTFTIAKASVSDASVSGITGKTYSGKAQTQSPTVKVDGNTLISGTDYSLSYEDNTDAGTATVTITGKGKNYKDSISKTFTIAKASVSDASVSGITGKTYSGKAQTQSPTVKVDGNTLTSGTDYSLSYEDNTNAGTATVTITGKGNYKDSISKTFTIAKASVSKASVSGISGKTYNGKAQTQSPTVKVNGNTLKSGTDYSLSYKNNTNVGTATVTITGKGNYKDSVSKTFTIAKASVSKASVSGITGKTYSGKAQTQSPTVKVNGNTLTSGTDYSLSYKKNTNAGTATVTITGKGNYKDSLSKTFTIAKASVSDASVSGISGKTYSGKAQTQSPTVKVDGNTLTSGTDYALSYKNNTNAGTATVTITGKGNYKGSIGKTFTIAKAAQNLTVKAKASSIQVGKTTTVSVTGAKGTKSFKSSNTAVATVNSKGLVTGKKAGTVKITVTSAATTNYKAASKSVTIKVVPVKVTKITLNKTALSLKKGKSATLKATVAPSNATNKAVTWKSSNTRIATVTSAGVVKGIANGSATITVTAKDGSGKKAACKVTVSGSQSIAKATVTYPATKVWTGWELTPCPTVKLGSKTLTHRTDYYQYFTNNTNVGIATITIKGTGDYTGTVKKTFRIIPKTTSISGLTAGRMQFTVKWNRQPSATTGYQISFSSRADFGTQKVVTVSNVNTTARTIKNLTGNHKYYVRVRTYKTVNGVRYHGNWSAVRTVTTK